MKLLDIVTLRFLRHKEPKLTFSPYLLIPIVLALGFAIFAIKYSGWSNELPPSYDLESDDLAAFSISNEYLKFTQSDFDRTKNFEEPDWNDNGVQLFSSKDTISFLDIVGKIKPDYNLKCVIADYSAEDKKFRTFPRGHYKNSKVISSGNLDNVYIEPNEGFAVICSKDFGTWDIVPSEERLSGAFNYSLDDKVSGWHLVMIPSKVKLEAVYHSCDNRISAIWSQNGNNSFKKLSFNDLKLYGDYHGVWIKLKGDEGSCIESDYEGSQPDLENCDSADRGDLFETNTKVCTCFDDSCFLSECDKDMLNNNKEGYVCFEQSGTYRWLDCPNNKNTVLSADKRYVCDTEDDKWKICGSWVKAENRYTTDKKYYCDGSVWGQSYSTGTQDDSGNTDTTNQSKRTVNEFITDSLRNCKRTDTANFLDGECVDKLAKEYHDRIVEGQRFYIDNIVNKCKMSVEMADDIEVFMDYSTRCVQLAGNDFSSWTKFAYQALNTCVQGGYYTNSDIFTNQCVRHPASCTSSVCGYMDCYTTSKIQTFLDMYNGWQPDVKSIKLDVCDSIKLGYLCKITLKYDSTKKVWSESKKEPVGDVFTNSDLKFKTATSYNLNAGCVRNILDREYSNSLIVNYIRWFLAEKENVINDSSGNPLYYKGINLYTSTRKG